MGNRSNRRGQPRRWVALLCLASVLAFAGLDAVHNRDFKLLEQQRSNTAPCLVCQLASSTLPVAGHAMPPPIAPASDRLDPDVALPEPVAQPRTLPDIRPPPVPDTL